MEMKSAAMLDSMDIDDDEDYIPVKELSIQAIQGSMPGGMYMQSQVPSF